MPQLLCISVSVRLLSSDEKGNLSSSDEKEDMLLCPSSSVSVTVSTFSHLMRRGTYPHLMRRRIGYFAHSSSVSVSWRPGGGPHLRIILSLKQGAAVYNR